MNAPQEKERPGVATGISGSKGTFCLVLVAVLILDRIATGQQAQDKECLF